MAKPIEPRIYPRDEHGDLLDGRHRRVWWRPAPAGVCHMCWIERRERRGRFYVWGYPSLTPGRGRCCCYCDECAERCRSMAIHLIPAGARRDPGDTADGRLCCCDECLERYRAGPDGQLGEP